MSAENFADRLTLTKAIRLAAITIRAHLLPAMGIGDDNIISELLREILEDQSKAEKKKDTILVYQRAIIKQGINLASHMSNPNNLIAGLKLLQETNQVTKGKLLEFIFPSSEERKEVLGKLNMLIAPSNDSSHAASSNSSPPKPKYQAWKFIILGQPKTAVTEFFLNSASLSTLKKDRQFSPERICGKAEIPTSSHGTISCTIVMSKWIAHNFSKALFFAEKVKNCNMKKAYYPNKAAGAIIILDINDPNSQASVEQWHSAAKNQMTYEFKGKVKNNITFVLFGDVNTLKTEEKEALENSLNKLKVKAVYCDSPNIPPHEILAGLVDVVAPLTGPEPCITFGASHSQ